MPTPDEASQDQINALIERLRKSGYPDQSLKGEAAAALAELRDRCKALSDTELNEVAKLREANTQITSSFGNLLDERDALREQKTNLIAINENAAKELDALRERVEELEGTSYKLLEEYNQCRERINEAKDLLQRAANGDSEGSWMQEVRSWLGH